MKYSELGRQLVEKIDKVYEDELERLRIERNDPTYLEGWCIIESDEFIHNLDEVCGLYLHGYGDHVFDIVEGEWMDCNGYTSDDECWLGYTYGEVLNKLKDCFELSDMERSKL